MRDHGFDILKEFFSLWSRCSSVRQTTSGKMRGAGEVGHTHMCVSVVFNHITASHGILSNLNFDGCKYCSFSRKETIQRKQISKEKRESSCLSCLSFLLFPSSPPFFPSCLASKVDKAGLWMRGAFIWTDCLSLWQKARVVRGECACVLNAR